MVSQNIDCRRTPEMKEEEEKRREPPQFVSKPEPVTVREGDLARFCCRVTGFPRPRVMWLVNGNTVVNVRKKYEFPVFRYTAVGYNSS